MYSKKDQTRKSAKEVVRERMSLPRLKKKVERVFNAWIRNRDKIDPCISCGVHREDNDAGHFINVGVCQFLRFDEENVNKQCRSCNKWKGGNKIEYRIALCKKIGKKAVEYLEDHRHDKKSWTRDELNELYIKYKVKNETT